MAAGAFDRLRQEWLEGKVWVEKKKTQSPKESDEDSDDLNEVSKPEDNDLREAYFISESRLLFDGISQGDLELLLMSGDLRVFRTPTHEKYLMHCSDFLHLLRRKWLIGLPCATQAVALRLLGLGGCRTVWSLEGAASEESVLFVLGQYMSERTNERRKVRKVDLTQAVMKGDTEEEAAVKAFHGINVLLGLQKFDIPELGTDELVSDLMRRNLLRRSTRQTKLLELVLPGLGVFLSELQKGRDSVARAVRRRGQVALEDLPAIVEQRRLRLRVAFLINDMLARGNLIKVAGSGRPAVRVL